MPFFQSMQDLKSLTASMNPLNLFAINPDQPQPPTGSSHDSSYNSVASPVTSNGAVAGPGPSSAASRRASAAVGFQPGTSSDLPSPNKVPARPSSMRQSSSSALIRPSLRSANTVSSLPSSSDSSEGPEVPATRKSSGVSVSIAEPETMERKRTPTKRGPRPISTASGLTTSSSIGEPRSRKRKAALDTYIIVKPPPTSSKNPLNLQIQLVVKPKTRGRDRSASAFSRRSASGMGEELVNSASASPATPAIDLPTEESDVSDGPENGGAAAAAQVDSPTSTSPPAPSNRPLPTPSQASGSPKSTSFGTADTDPSSLQRSTSLRSSLSTSTAATGTSTASGKRIEPMFNLAVHNVMQPTVVTDAATDVKVAKFHRRNLDISGVGVLEPSEVWLRSNDYNPFSGPRRASDDVEPRKGRPLSVASLTAPLSPTMTRSDDGRPSGVRASLDLKGFKLDKKADGHESGAKKFFGKIFKKKPSISDLAVPARESNGGHRSRKTSPSASFSSPDRVSGTLVSPEANSQSFAVASDNLYPSGAPNHKTHSLSTQDHPSVHLGHPTFGTAPLVVRRQSSGAVVTPEGAVTGLTAPVDHSTIKAAPAEDVLARSDRCQPLPIIPSSRPVGYTWTVRKWAKRNQEGWAAHLVAAANAGLEMVGGHTEGEGDNDVLFEWVKLRVPPSAAGDEIIRRYSTTGAISTARTRSRSRAASVAPVPTLASPVHSPMLAPTRPVDEIENHSKTSLTLQPPRRSASPFPPTSPGLNLSSNQNSPTASPQLDGRPEPVRRISASASPSRRASSNTLNQGQDLASVHFGDEYDEDDSDPEDSETPWICSVWVKKTGHRQLLGTLTPAPHHPKVIGILKIPIALESVCLTDMATASVKGNTGVNGQTNASLEQAAKRVREGIALTEENLKDVVCVTAMWLVAREEFGGLGRKKRRGTMV